MPSSARSRPYLPGPGPLSHIPGIGVWEPSGPTHSLGRRAAAATAPRGLLASLQAQLATPARGCTGLIKAVHLESQEPALLLPGKAAAPPPPFSLPTFLPPPPLPTPPEPCARGSLAPRARRSVESWDLRAPGGWSFEHSPGGHFPTSWGLTRLLGVWEPCGEGGRDGERNPQQIQICGRLQYLGTDMPLFVAKSLPHLQWPKLAPPGRGCVEGRWWQQKLPRRGLPRY